ncbi:MAG: AMP-binding protein, partial [Chloroflexi bacterium]|nr:AMP-binding protein [Chloroflexota bacterium]
LQVRGPRVIGSYLDDAERSAVSFQDGWLRTGDVGAIDRHGYVEIVDRAKDLVKSGGEWISSIDLENAIMAHPAVLEASVFAVFHEKWQERPVAAVVLRPGATATEADILDVLRPKFAKWWLPDAVLFVDAVPKTSVGKFDKKVLRERYKELLTSSVTSGARE